MPVTDAGQQASADRISSPTPVTPVYTGFDPNEYDRVNLDWVISGGLKGLQESRAWDQGALELAGKFVGNAAGTFLFEAMKMPGYLAAAPGLFTGGGVDNAYLRGIKALQEGTQGRWFEVFTPPSISESENVWDHFNRFFVAGDVANGVGFLASFLLPGQVLKALGTGNAITSGLTRMGRLADTVVDGEKLIQAGNANMFGRLLLKTAGRSGRATDFGGAAVGWSTFAANADSASAVAINTLLESAAEASEMFDNLTAQGVSKEEAGRKSSQVFKANIVPLLLSNALVEKYLLNGFNRLSNRPFFEVVKQAVDSGDYNMLRRAVTKTGSSLIGSIGQEGFLEEGFQSTIQQVAEGGDITVGKLLSAYADNIQGMFTGDPEAIDFTKSVVLGGLLGSLTGVTSSISEAKHERDFLLGRAAQSPGTFGKLLGRKDIKEDIPGAISMIKGAVGALQEDITQLYDRKDDGTVTLRPDAAEKLKEVGSIEILQSYYADLIRMNNGDTKAAGERFARELVQAVGMERAGEIYRIVRSDLPLSNTEAMALMQHQADQRYFHKFLNLEGGAELLRAHIADSVDTIAERYEHNTGVKMSNEQKANLLSEMNERAEEAIRERETVLKDHDQLRINFKPKNADEQTVDIFMRNAKHGRMAALSARNHFRRRRDALVKEREELLSEVSYTGVEERKAQLADLEQRITEVEAELGSVRKGAEKRKETLTKTRDALTKERSTLTGTIKGMTTKLDKRAQELTEKIDGEIKQLDEVAQGLNDEYIALSSRSGLQKLWNAQRTQSPPQGEKQDQGPASQESSGESPQQPVRNVTWPDFRKTIRDAGYEEGETVYATSGPHELMIIINTEADKPYIDVRNAADPNRKGRYGNPTEVYAVLPKLTITPKADYLAAQEEREAKRKAEDARVIMDNMLGALRRRMADFTALIKSNEKAIADAERTIRETSQELLRYDGRKRTGKELLKRMGKEAFNAKKKQLRETVDNAEATIPKLRAQQAVLRQKVELFKDYVKETREGSNLRELAKDRRERYNQLRAELEMMDLLAASATEIEDAINGYSDLIKDMEAAIEQLRRRITILEGLGKSSDATAEFIGSELIQQLTDKYSYTDRGGRTRTLSFDGPLTEQDAGKLRSHLEKVAEQRGTTTDKLLADLKDDYEQLRIANQLSEMGTTPSDLLIATEQEFERAGQELDTLNQQLETANLASKIKMHEEERENIRKLFRDAEGSVIVKEAAPGQLWPDNDGGDTLLSEQGLENILNGPLSSELFGTTGDTIQMDGDAGDLFDIQESGIEVPRLTPSIQQQHWARWIDNMFAGTVSKNYQVKATVAYYDARDGLLADAFQRENPSDQDSGNDVFVYITDKKGGLIFVDDKGNPVNNARDGYPLIRAVRRVHTKFPATPSEVRMNRFSLINLYREALGLAPVSREVMSDGGRVGIPKKDRERLATIMGVEEEALSKMSSFEFHDKLFPMAVDWGRRKYAEQLDIIKANAAKGNPTDLTLTGITDGHPVFFRKDGKVMMFSIREALGLETKDGKPRNFEAGKVDRTGVLQIGQKKYKNLKPGGFYVREAGSDVPIETQQRGLNEEEIDTVMHILYEASKRNTLEIETSDIDTESTVSVMFDEEVPLTIARKGVTSLPFFPGKHGRYSLITTIMNWGLANRKVRGKYDINITRNVLWYGVDGKLSMESLREAYTNGDPDGMLTPLREFLAIKRRHINYTLLHESLTQKNFRAPVPVLQDGMIHIQYRPYLDEALEFSETSSPPQEMLDRYNLPRLAQRNMQFALLTDHVESVAKPTVAKTEEGVGEKPVKSDKDLLNESDKKTKAPPAKKPAPKIDEEAPQNKLIDMIRDGAPKEQIMAFTNTYRAQLKERYGESLPEDVEAELLRITIGLLPIAKQMAAVRSDIVLPEGQSLAEVFASVIAIVAYVHTNMPVKAPVAAEQSSATQEPEISPSTTDKAPPSTIVVKEGKGELLEALATNQGRKVELVIKGSKGREFLLSYDIRKGKWSIFSEKTEHGTFTAGAAFHEQKDVDDLVSEYLESYIIDELKKLTALSNVEGAMDIDSEAGKALKKQEGVIDFLIGTDFDNVGNALVPVKDQTTALETPVTSTMTTTPETPEAQEPETPPSGEAKIITKRTLPKPPSTEMSPVEGVPNSFTYVYDAYTSEMEGGRPMSYEVTVTYDGYQETDERRMVMVEVFEGPPEMSVEGRGIGHYFVAEWKAYEVGPAGMTFRDESRDEKHDVDATEALETWEEVQQGKYFGTLPQPIVTEEGDPIGMYDRPMSNEWEAPAKTPEAPKPPTSSQEATKKGRGKRTGKGRGVDDADMRLTDKLDYLVNSGQVKKECS